MATDPTLVLVGHGTRAPRGRRALGLLAAAVRELWDGPVHLCFVDVQPPTPLGSLRRVAGPDASPNGSGGQTSGTVLVPALLSTGFHIKVDIPEAIAESGSDVAYAPPLGPSEEIAALLARLVLDRSDGPPSSVLLAATGSSDPAAAVDVRQQALLLSDALGGAPVSVGFASAGEPSLRAALSAAPPGTVVASYLLAPGFFSDRIAEAARDHGFACTQPLLDSGGGPNGLGENAVRAIAELVLKRARATATGTRSRV